MPETQREGHDTRRVQGWVHTKTRIQSSSTPRLLKYCSKTCTLHEDSHFLLLKLPLHYDLNAKDCTFTPLHLLESHNIGYLVWKDECWFMCCATFGSLVHWILNSLRFLLEYCLCGWLSLWLKAKLSPKWNLGFFLGECIWVKPSCKSIIMTKNSLLLWAHLQ